MLSRLFSRLLILASVAVLAGVTYSFMSAYRDLRRRERAVQAVGDMAAAEGPCAGLAALEQASGGDAELYRALGGLRSHLVSQVVGEEDLKGRRVLAAAFREGIVDRPLCEQIRSSHELGETHPVLALLRYTREGGSPCEEEPRLAQVLDGLGAHRPVMLRALMRDVRELGCLSPSLSEKIAAMVARTASESPGLVDGLDVPRVAEFLGEWAPVETAELGCRALARGDRSELATTVGCTAEAREHTLVHYRTLAALPASDRAPALPASSDVVLVHEDGAFCEVVPGAGGALRTVACETLRLASDLVIGVRIEALSYGRAEADLVGGLAAYAGAAGELTASTREPDLRSWFAYDGRGELLGAAHRVELGAIAAMLGEAVPDQPLRAFCKRSGAAYCYDVDWAHVVSRLPRAPVLYLSRPADVFLDVDTAGAAERFHEAFGRDPAPGGWWRTYSLTGGGALAFEAADGRLDVRWRLGERGPWRAQELGRGADRAGSARLLAALDVRRDGRPELVVQRTVRAAAGAPGKDPADDILLVQPSPAGDRLVVVNRLTVHEY